MSPTRVVCGPSAPAATQFGRLAVVLLVLLLGSLLGQSSLALAISPVEIWNGGVYDDAPQADIPMASCQIAALPCSAAGPCVPAGVVGTVTGRPEADCVAPLLEVSRSRAPPLA